MKKVLVINNCQWWTQDEEYRIFKKILDRIADVIKAVKFDTVILTKELCTPYEYAHGIKYYANTEPVLDDTIRSGIYPHILDAAKKYAKNVKVIEKHIIVTNWKKVFPKYKEVDLTYIEMANNDYPLESEASRIVDIVGNVVSWTELFYKTNSTDAHSSMSKLIDDTIYETASRLSRRTASASNSFIEPNTDDRVFWKNLSEKEAIQLRDSYVWQFVTDAVEGYLDDNYEFTNDGSYYDKFECGARIIIR